LRHYADAVRMPDLETVVTLGLRFQHAPPPSLVDAPILAPALDTWGAASLLLPIAELTQSSTAHALVTPVPQPSSTATR
jgi:hypothetical protein